MELVVDCIADLHGNYLKLEGGDLLIIAGDLTGNDSDEEHKDFIFWLAQLQTSEHKYKKVIYIGGNHDNFLYDPNRHGAIKTTTWNIDYLCDSGTEFEGFKIWGSPWTTTFKGMNPMCKAFTVDTEIQLGDKFESIPWDTDILITHSPPRNVLDKTIDGRNVGSNYLYAWFKYVERPMLHVFGHIHEGYGQQEYFCGYNDTKVKSVNASHVNYKYQPVNPPVRVILNNENCR